MMRRRGGEGKGRGLTTFHAMQIASVLSLDRDHKYGDPDIKDDGAFCLSLELERHQRDR